MNTSGNNNLCIIPARGGSKRIPRKNIKDFLGKPIIAYSIQAALESGLFNEVMVSTDDEEIADVAVQYGATVPFLRSEETSNDFATTSVVLEEVIHQYKKQERFFSNLCCIYPCAPFVTKEKVHEAFQLLMGENYDSVFPVMSFSFPIQRALRKDMAAKVSYFYPEFQDARSQDLEKSYHDAGQFYWMNLKKIDLTKSLLTNNTGIIEITELEGQDIDNETDWKLAELKYTLLRNEISY